MNKIPHLITILVTVGLLAGCGANPESPAPAANLVPKAFTTTPPEGTPVPIPQLRAEAKPGDSVVLAAKVMGVKDPFVEGLGVFVVGDEATLTSCDLMDEDDTCPTPWDACCDAPEARVAGTATIQLLDEQGNLLDQGLKGVGGLQELSRVLVAGTVASQAAPESLVINAQTIYVVP